MKKNTIFLLPELIKENDKTSFFYGAKPVDDRPVKVSGYSVYTFLDRLDEIGFPYYAVTIESQNEKSFLYKHTFTDNIPDFKSFYFKEKFIPDVGTVIYLISTAFDSFSVKYQSVAVKGGDWLRVSNSYNQIGALHHLGIIPDISQPAFSKLRIDRWAEPLHQTFGTNGTIEEALHVIFNRMKYASIFFNIISDDASLKQLDIPEGKYCFGALNKLLQNSAELEILRHILPVSQRNASNFYILNQFLLIVYDALNKSNAYIDNIDDYTNFDKALHSFQIENQLSVGPCDNEALKKLTSISSFKIVEQLPVFRIAGIEVSYDQIMDFPPIAPLHPKSKDQLDQVELRVMQEINDGISATTNPNEKISWMNDQIIDCVNESNDRCNMLTSQVTEIEKTVKIMTRMLTDVAQETQAASNRVKVASRTLNNVYDKHMDIQGQFETLRDRLFSEQKNTRIILLIGIFITFLGALELFRN
ncbi:hypothetical protein M9Y10_041517 [Tritrichomonas musculus]|uniref:Uncharacterized protein n=1 Tax=Tritrichomonas musculus TaxID=1915356 RepID=A0ABR2K4L4_9EUKA